MTLNFKTQTNISIPPDNIFGLKWGYNFLEPELRQGSHYSPFYVTGSSAYDRVSLSDAADRSGIIRLDRNTIPTTPLSYMTAGTAHPDNKFEPSEKALMTAALFEQPIYKYEMVSETVSENGLKGLFGLKRNETRQVATQIGTTKELIVDFITNYIEMGGHRTAALTMQLKLTEPSDESGKREFKQLVDGLAGLGRTKTGDLILAENAGGKALIQPTIISTRQANNVKAYRPDALAGLLERTNKVLRGAIAPDAQVSVSAAQFIKLMETELGIVSAPTAKQTYASTQAKSAPQQKITDEETLFDKVSEANKAIEAEVLARAKEFGKVVNAGQTPSVAEQKTGRAQTIKFRDTFREVVSSAMDLASDGVSTERLGALKKAVELSDASKPGDLKHEVILKALSDCHKYIADHSQPHVPVHQHTHSTAPSREEMARRMAADSPSVGTPKPRQPIHTHTYMPRR